MRHPILLVTLCCFCALPALGNTYFMSSSGLDSNNGASPGTPWATPNHALNCGDVIQAAAGTYGQIYQFGAVTCSAGNNVAWLTCAAFDACKVVVSSGGQYYVGITMGASYWGVQGFEVNTGSNGACFFFYPSSTTGSIHHLVAANDICNTAGQGGFVASANGSAGVDYLAVVGSIAYNTSQGSGAGYNCDSAFNVGQPVAYDSNRGTHIYLAGNFAWDTVNGNPCGGGTPTDGQGFVFDTFQGVGAYGQQAVIDNNISVFNGGNGIKAINNSTSSPNAKIYIRHNTTYGNETGSVNGAVCAEIGLQAALSVEADLNLSQTNATTACSGPVSLYVLGTTSANSTDILYSNYGYSSAGSNTSVSSATLVNNTFSNPSFANPTNPGAPSCGTYASVPACAAKIIANFTPTNTAALGYGFQTPSTTSTYDPLFPQWLCNVNLPPGLVTMGCLQLQLTVQIS
jgi:hypothetical protein